MSESVGKWTIFERFILIISIVVNIWLWLDKQHKNSAIESATYNEKAWEANGQFDVQIAKLNTETEKKIYTRIIEPAPTFDEQYKIARELNSAWLVNYRKLRSQLESKYTHYSSVIDGELDAMKQLQSSAEEIRSPIESVIIFMDATITEREKIADERNLNSTRARFGYSTRVLKQHRDKLKMEIQESKVAILEASAH